MLRRCVLAAGVVLILLAAVAFLAGAPAGAIATPAVLGLIVTAGIVYERRGKKLADTRPGPGWVETGERFIDPETGRLVTVFHQPETGERRYVGR